MKPVALVVLLALAACAPAQQNSLTPSLSPPGDAYTCLLRELSIMGYAVTDTDRESGFVKAEKQDDNSWVAGAYFTLITAIVIPAEAGAGSEIQLTVARAREEEGGERSTSGMMLTGNAKEDAGRLSAACSG